jgi:hypothetical protein
MVKEAVAADGVPNQPRSLIPSRRLVTSNHLRREDMTIPGHLDRDGAVITLTEQGDNTI